MGLRRWLEARWYGDAPVPLWLDLLSRLYGRVAARRREGQRKRAQRLPVPVIVVGNLSVGGTGKTPVVIAIVNALKARGYSPGVISRGYGGRERGPVELGVDADPDCCGDEPVLIAWRSQVPVVVARDRVAAGRLLLASHPNVDVLVSDDGLQHHRLARDVEIVVVDGRRRHGNARLLPAGPLREPLTRLSEVDLVLINGARAEQELGFDLQVDAVWALVGATQADLSDLAASAPVHAVAGIGDPSRFFATLRSAGLSVIEHPFPDHHRYRLQDLDFRDGQPVLMTEKDAVKCREFALPNWYALPVFVELPAGVIDQVVTRIRNPGD